MFQFYFETSLIPLILSSNDLELIIFLLNDSLLRGSLLQRHLVLHCCTD